MYSTLLILHSLLRWLVLAAGVAAAWRGLAGWKGRPWSTADARAGLVFVSVLDLQLLIGLVLYLFVSPTVKVAALDFGAAMRDSVLRFFLVEHALGMLIAITLAHLGRIRIRKAATDVRRHRAAAVFFGLALLVVLLSIPWPGMPAARPLWPW